MVARRDWVDIVGGILNVGLLVSGGHIWLEIISIRAVARGLLGVLRLSVTIVQRIVRVWRWRRCVFVVITSRAGNGRIRRGMGWRGWGTHEQFLILDAGVRTGSVGPCGICMLVGSAIEWIPMRKVVALVEAWVSAQQAWLVHMGLVGSPLWYTDWWGTWCVVVLALYWVGIMMVSHDGWMGRRGWGKRCLKFEVGSGFRRCKRLISN